MIYSDLAIAGAFIKSLDNELIFGILVVDWILCLSAPSNINKLCFSSFNTFNKFIASFVLLNEDWVNFIREVFVDIAYILNPNDILNKNMVLVELGAIIDDSDEGQELE